jgi:hypothetical protein
LYVIKALMHHQYRICMQKQLYGAHHYTYANEAHTMMLRALWYSN